ncbi:DUF2341 domain-containing protein [Candidatus Peregrinibacteria bacterium]|nr:DUF2341 domain-containing protein [Candidatus Peregrinibacteria bacterium]
MFKIQNWLVSEKQKIFIIFFITSSLLLLTHILIVQAAIPNQPTISSPTSLATGQGINLTLTSANFSGDAPHTVSDWEIYTSSTAIAGNLVWSKYDDSSNLTSITVNTTNGIFSNALSGQTALATGTRYWARVRHANASGDSNWSVLVGFKTSISETVGTQNWTFGEATTNYTYDNAKISVNASSDSLTKLISSSGDYAFINGVESTTRRKKITVTENSGSTLTNFPVLLNITYDSDMQADFDDLRFTSSDGTTQLDYWLEGKTDSTSAMVWVEAPSITASSTATIYMYYGNASLSSNSNGSNVFTFFDDFTGASLDANWDTDGYIFDAPTITVSGGVLTVASAGGWKMLKLNYDFAPSFTGVIETRFQKLANDASHTSEIWNSDGSNRFGLTDGEDCGYTGDAMGAFLGVNGNFPSTDVYCPSNLGSFSVNTWYKTKITKGSSTNLAVNGSSDARVSIGSYSSTQNDWSAVTWDWVTAISGGASTKYDWLFIRKYASSDPSSSMGSEQANSSYDGIKILPASAGTHPTYTNLYGFTETLGGSNAGSTYYQISNNGTSWYYHNGTSWTAVTTDSTDNNTAASVNFWLDDFDTVIGTGNFYYKAFLVSNGNQAVEINNLAVTYTATPSTPTIASPANGATGVSRTPTLESSAFSGAPGHTSSNWQIATDSGFNTIVATKSTDTTNLTSIVANSTNFTFQNALATKTYLTPNTTYYARVQHTNAVATSSWSTGISFTVAANTVPATPSISSPSNGATSQSRTLTLTSSAFSDSESDTHTSSTWEIATDSGFTSIVAIKSSDTSNKTSITVNSTNFTFQGTLSGKTELLPSTTYYTRASYTDSENGTSSTSSVISFTTEVNATPSKPTISSPTNAATNQARNQLVSSAAFSDADPDDTHQSSDWEVYDDIDLTRLVAFVYDSTSKKTSVALTSSNLTFQNALSGKELLDPEVTYYVRMRHTDSENQDSNWSNAIAFTTGTNVAPNKPSIISPSSGAIETSTTPTLQSSAFSDTDDTQHVSSSWEIYDSSLLGSSNLVWQKLNDSANKTSIIVNDSKGTFSNAISGRTKLLPGTTYYARMLQMDAASADSDWANMVSFTTVTPPANPTLASISHPSESDYFRNATPSFTTSAGTPTPNHYHYLINQNATPTKLEVESGTSDEDGSFTVPSGTINANGTWYVHMIAHDVNHNPSVTFDTYTIKYNSSAPTISNITASNITANSSTITWNTLNATTTSQVDYGTSSGNYTLSGTQSAETTSHQVSLTSLSGSTAYYYIVTSVDSYGQTNVSSEKTFTTLGLTTISGVTATNISTISAVITWTTNHAATSKVNYGTSTAYGSDIQSTDLVTSHSITITGLTAGLTYYYEIISVGNSTATDAYHTFATISNSTTTVTTNQTSSGGGSGSGGSSSSSSSSMSSKSDTSAKNNETKINKTETNPISTKFEVLKPTEKNEEKQREILNKIAEERKMENTKPNGPELRKFVFETIENDDVSKKNKYEIIDEKLHKILERKDESPIIRNEENAVDIFENSFSGTVNIDEKAQIQDNDWIEPYIAFMEKTGFISATEKKQIDADKIHAPTTRCAVSKTVVEYFFLQTDENEPSTFTDMDQKNPCTKYVMALKKTGAIHGYPDGTFRPNASINRAEALKIITLAVTKYFKTEFKPQDFALFSNPFLDVKDDQWFTNYIKFGFHSETIIGYPDSTFKPDKEITSAETLKILVRTLTFFEKISTEAKQAIDKDLTKTPSFIEKFFTWQ